MNEGTVQNAFSFKYVTVDPYEESNIPGNFQWNQDGSDMSFYPQNSCNFGKYKISLLPTAKDGDGNDILYGTNTTFNIGNQGKYPIIVSTYPLNNAAILSGSNLIITVSFSESINTAYMSSMFSVSPSLNYQITAVSNNTVFELLPLSVYQNGQYTLSFNTNSIIDLSGNMLRPTPNLFFTIGTNFNPPRLLGIYTNPDAVTGPLTLTNGLNNIDKNNNLYFSFNKSLAVNLNNIPINFSPQVSGTWATNSSANVLSFTPSSYWNIGTAYTVTVNSGFKDIFGNVSQNTYQSYLEISNSFIFLTNIIYSDSGSDTVNWNSSALNYGPFKPGNITIYLYFSTSLQPVSVLPNIGINTFNSINNSISITTIAFMTNNSPNDSICVTLMNPSNYILYYLSVNGGTGGLRDMNQNWLSSNINIFFNLTN